MSPLFSRLPLAVAVLVAAGCALPGLPGSQPTAPNGVVVGLKGEMEFAFTYPDAPAQRRLLATIEDVAYYRITLKRPDGSLVKEPDLYSAPTPAKRKVSHRIGDLPPGDYVVLIEALDADKEPIGQAEKNVSVIAGKCVEVPISLKLDDEILAPTVGKIGLVVDVVDGDQVTPSPDCCSIPPDYEPLLPVPSATPTPSPTPTPTPTPSPTPRPTTGPVGIWYGQYFAYSEWGVYSLKNAVDGNENSNWYSSPGEDDAGRSYIGKDLGVSKAIGSIYMSQPGNYSVSRVIVQASDSIDGPWADLQGFNVEPGENNLVLTNPPSRRYWRVLADSDSRIGNEFGARWGILEISFNE